MKTVIIDVRTKKEFDEGSYPGAINLPSQEFDIDLFSKYKFNHIALVCSSGNRASRIQTRLKLAGFENVSLMLHQMVHLEEGSAVESTLWTVDRQFRMTLGLLIGLFLVGNYIFNSTLSIGLLLLIFAGLIYSAITDNCYLKVFISNLPWNKMSEESNYDDHVSIEAFNQAV